MKINFSVMVCALALTTLNVNFASAQACGNAGRGGTTNPDAEPQTGDPVQVYSGNEYREINDLTIWGGSGEHALTWKRWANSRDPGGTNFFGNGHSWRHDYQWEMTPPTGGKLWLHYPNGAVYTYLQQSPVANGPAQAGANPILWRPSNGGDLLSIGDLLYQSQNLVDLYLQRANGYLYHFTKTTNTNGYVSYLMVDFYDAFNGQYLLSYNNNQGVVKITEPGGRYFQITYASLSLNNFPFTALATIGSVPVAGQWTTLPVSDTHTYRYLLYQAPDSSYGDVADIQFYDTAGHLLTGTPIGAGSAATAGTDFSKALDGNSSTYFESSVPTGNFVGIDLGAGSSATVGSVKFYPRAGYEARMYIQPNIHGATTGSFVGSNVTPAHLNVISKVTASDGRSITYNYQTFGDSTLPTTFQVLASVTYEDGSQATYTSVQIAPSTRPLVTAFIDPRDTLPLAKSRNVYYTDSASNLGQVYQQLSYDTQDVLQTIGTQNGNVHIPTSTSGNGAVEAFTMNNGVMISSVDGLGRTKTYTYADNGWGYPTSVKDALGRTTSTTPSAFGNPLAITYPDGTHESWTRDSRDLVLTHTDALGRVTTYARDAAHRITQVTYPNGSSESFTYNALGKVLVHTLSNGGTEVSTYDARGLLTQKHDALGNVWSYAYDAFDRVSRITDPRNNAESYAYDSRGHIVKTTHADGSIRTSTYDLFGSKTSETDELGHTSTYGYDQFKRIVSVQDALGRVTTTAFHANTPLTHPDSITLPSGKKVTSTYDLEWNLLSQTTGAGTTDAATTAWQYDNANRPVKTIDPLGHATVVTYDLLNRRLTSTDPLAHVSKWSYDAAGNVLTATRPDNGMTTNGYNAMDQLTTTTNPKGEATTYGYDNVGRLATVTDARGSHYTYAYDLLNRTLTTTWPDGSLEAWSYDPAGNRRGYTNRHGAVETFTHDVRNREVGYTWSDGTPAVTRTLDVAGRLLTSVNGISSSAYSYDVAGQLLSETQTNAVLGTAWPVDYSYDLDGNRIAVVYPSGTLVSYGYTARNQVNAIGAGGSGVATYVYDAAGNVLTKGLADGTIAGYSYDAANRLTTLNHTLGGSSFARFDYGYDSVNRRTFEQRDLGKGDVYTYDAVDQVSGVQYDATTPGTVPAGAARTVGYAYDATGNRTAVTDTVNGNKTYTANSLNEYTVVGATAYSYDANGNLTGGNGIYTYDAQNRLESAAVGGNTDSFFYDSKNRVVQRTVNGVNTYLIYDGWNLIEERNGSGSLLATYIHGVRQDELLVKINATAPVYYHHNALGSVVSLTSASGVVIEKYKYDVFGKPSVFNGSGSLLTSTAYGNRFCFTGQEWRAEVNLYDYRNRAYSIELGRFLQSDPLRFTAGDVNIYRYVGNNVINFIDPTGLNGFGDALVSTSETTAALAGVAAAAGALASPAPPIAAAIETGALISGGLSGLEYLAGKTINYFYPSDCSGE